jgi:hypothetical protein
MYENDFKKHEAPYKVKTPLGHNPCYYAGVLGMRRYLSPLIFPIVPNKEGYKEDIFIVFCMNFFGTVRRPVQCSDVEAQAKSSSTDGYLGAIGPRAGGSSQQMLHCCSGSC